LKENEGGRHYLKLLVRDWGQGFDPGSGLNSPGHFGLRGLEERVHSLTGRCSIETSIGNGVQIEAAFPL
jgi:NarL family two-component system sensor histidine kinase YdfH